MNIGDDIVFKIRKDEGVYDIHPRLEGLHLPSGKIIGFELLSNITFEDHKKFINPRHFFLNIDFITLEYVISKQLDLAIELFSFADPNIFISLNLDARGLYIVNTNPHILSAMKYLKNKIRVEIDEDCDLNLNYDLLKKTSTLCPLWLDDFGKGQFSSQITYKNLFSGIKIDKNLLSSIIHLPNGSNLFNDIIKSLKTMYALVIVEGVENETLANQLVSSEVDILQGWHWKSQNLNSQQIFEAIHSRHIKL